MPGGADVVIIDGAEAALQRVAAGMLGGVGPREFQAGIEACHYEMGNRAFLGWVGEWQGEEGRKMVHSLSDEVAEAGMPVASSRLSAAAPLQLMSKKKKKQESVPVGEEEAQAVSAAAALRGSGGQPRAESEAQLPQQRPRESTVAGQKKKKKKSRVQVALNTLRTEGVEAFKAYIEAEIGEVDLLRTLVERIIRAGDLGGIKAEALKAVEARLRVLDPESVPVISQASASLQGQGREVPEIAPVKSELSQRERELFDACFNGSVGKVRRLLRHVNVDVNIATKDGTLLCYAANYNHTAIVRELLSRPGIDVNLAAPTGFTPLFYAAQEGHAEVVKLLLAAPGINVDLASNEDVTPLYIATEMGHVEVVRLLLAAPGINVNSATSNEGAVPLDIAADKGWEDIVGLLLDAPNIDIDARIDDDGATPLYIAAQNNFPRIVEQLVRRGVDVDLVRDDGTTSLCGAASIGNLEAVRVLLRAPAIAIDLAGEDGMAPLAFASQEGYKDIVRLLLRKGADPNIKNKTGITPLHLASLRGHTGIVEMLSDAGADMDAEMEDKGQRYTPYSLAHLAGQWEVMSVLAAHRRRREEEAARLEDLSPCLRPQGQAPAGEPVGSTPATMPPPATMSTAQPGETVSIPVVSPDNPGEGSGVPAETLSATTADAPPTPVRSAEAGSGAEASSPLAQAQDGLRQEVLRKLEQDTLEPLEGIRLLEAVNAAADIDRLCNLYNRLAGMERQRERSRWRGRGREVIFRAPAQAGTPLFALGEREGLDAEAADAEVKRHLEQRYHRFVGQAVNDMEFGRGKRTSGYPGLWHASAGVAGVGSCSVFYYSDEETQQIRIVGIGHHVGRAAYRLDYAAEGLGRVGRILHIA